MKISTIIRSEPAGRSHTEEYKIIDGAILKLATLMTYYRHNLDWTERRQQEAETILERWLKVCEFTEKLPPLKFLECFCDDLNTIKAIALMHTYRKTDGKKLFACLRYLGFFVGEGGLPEVKTLPEDHVSVSFGPDTVGKA